MSPPANPLILRRVALTALDDAREAWKRARKSPTASHVRDAYRACLFAARALRRAAPGLPRESRRMIEQSERLETNAAELGAELVAIVVDAEAAPAKP